MWQDENMPEKIETLEKQKEKFSEISSEETVWYTLFLFIINSYKAHHFYQTYTSYYVIFLIQYLVPTFPNLGSLLCYDVLLI